MSLFESVTEEEFEEAHKEHVFCGTPTLTEEERQWREEHYDKSNWPETFPCEFCGCCPHPGQCVRSVACPRCFRVAGFSCVRPNDPAVIDPYHIERWKLVQSMYGTYYK